MRIRVLVLIAVVLLGAATGCGARSHTYSAPAVRAALQGVGLKTRLRADHEPPQTIVLTSVTRPGFGIIVFYDQKTARGSLIHSRRYESYEHKANLILGYDRRSMTVALLDKIHTALDGL